MKKLRIFTIFFCASGLLVGPGIAFSQTTEASITQSGTNVATVKQSNTGDVKISNIIDAKVDQTHTGGVVNTVEVTQEISDTDDPLGSLLTTTATQHGSENTIKQEQKNDGSRSRDDFVYRSFMASQHGDNNYASQSSVDGDQGRLEFEVEQVGNNNKSYQLTDESGGSTFNKILRVSKGIISQLGNWNEARQTMKSLDATGDIDQRGNNNIANQSFGNSTKENHGLIDQGGSNNDATQNFSGNNTRISRLNAYQINDGNYALQEVHIGNNNIGNVNQTSLIGNPKMGNEAYQKFVGNSNIGDITQTGLDNWADQDALGSNNDLDIVQVQQGVWGNTATQYVTGNYNGKGSLIEASIDQYGSNNTASQMIYGSYENAWIDQDDDDHTAQQEFTSTSHNNNSGIDQKGINNDASMYIEGYKNNSYIDQFQNGSTAKQYIYGSSSSYNWSKINQNFVLIGSNNTSEQYITGSTNSTSTFQEGSNGIAKQTIVGSHNFLLIKQEGFGNNTQQSVTGNNNDPVKSIQYGNNGMVTQTIIGNNNTSTSYQENNTNNAKVSIIQEGMLNITNLSQSIGSSEAKILQQGNNNTLQGLSENLDAAINNNSSYLEVDQLGDFHITNASQTAFGAWADINQNGYGTVANLNQY